jgi:hypothetical protein
LRLRSTKTSLALQLGVQQSWSVSARHGNLGMPGDPKHCYNPR